ncbi:MAG: ester cyclase [Candidatus Hodarchaeales archaeon]|jgi:predicted ester cyclase
MSSEQNRALIKQLYKDFDNRSFLTNENSWKKYIDNNFKWLQTEGHEFDKEGFLGFFGWLVDTFPDIKAPIEIFASEGDKVVVKYTCNATMTKDFVLPDGSLTLPAHGKKISWFGADLYEFKENKITRCETYTNVQLLMNALQS